MASGHMLGDTTCLNQWTLFAFGNFRLRIMMG